MVGEAYPLDNVKAKLAKFYAGQQIPSPNGGFLILLGVRPTGDGTATAIFECSSSSLRYSLQIPKATRTERKKVKDALGEGGDVACPRHGPGHPLVRAGKDLICNECLVAFAKV